MGRSLSPETHNNNNQHRMNMNVFISIFYGCLIKKFRIFWVIWLCGPSLGPPTSRETVYVRQSVDADGVDLTFLLNVIMPFEIYLRLDESADQPADQLTGPFAVLCAPMGFAGQIGDIIRTCAGYKFDETR